MPNNRSSAMTADCNGIGHTCCLTSHHDQLLMEAPDFLSTDLILRRFAKSRPKAQAQYRRFVRAGKKEASPWKALKGQCLLGGKELIEKLSPYLKPKTAIKEIRLVDRKVLRPDLAQLFSDAKLA